MFKKKDVLKLVKNEKIFDHKNIIIPNDENKNKTIEILNSFNENKVKIKKCIFVDKIKNRSYEHLYVPYSAQNPFHGYLLTSSQKVWLEREKKYIDTKETIKCPKIDIYRKETWPWKKTTIESRSIMTVLAKDTIIKDLKMGEMGRILFETGNNVEDSLSENHKLEFEREIMQISLNIHKNKRHEMLFQSKYMNKKKILILKKEGDDGIRECKQFDQAFIDKIFEELDALSSDPEYSEKLETILSSYNESSECGKGGNILKTIDKFE